MADKSPRNDNAPVAAPDAMGQPESPTGKPCAMCGKPALMKYRPFCSKRCADLDLSRWLNGVYAIPAKETEEDDEDGEEG